MKIGFYPKLAFDGMRKNGRLYVPYLVTCILMVAVYYILHFLAKSGILESMPGGTTASMMLNLGTGIITVFALIFLFYTQSTLIKGRKKEFGLYSILGMNKRNLARIIFWETMIIWAVSLIGGLVAGIGFSKLAELGFTRLIEVPVRYTFSVSKSSIVMDVVVFTIIFLLIYINSIRQVSLSSPIELLRSDKAGEKAPRSNWVVGIAGLFLLAAGYYLSIRIEQPMAALLWFMVAVILIVIGTYLTLIAGSVIFCRMLQKNIKFYYQTNHFVSVSSMTYRMKRNGAGLASICILLTMVLVMMSATSALYVGSEQCLNARYPNEIGAFACNYGYNEEYDQIGETLDAQIRSTSEAAGATIANDKTYSIYSISGYFDNNKLDVTLNSMTDMAFIDYDKVAQILFIDVEEYNRVFHHDETVASGDAIVGTAKNIEIGEDIIIGEVPFHVTKRIDDSISEIDPAAAGAASPGIYVIVNDVEEVAQHYIQYTDWDGEPMLAWFWYSRFDTGLDEEGQVTLAKDLEESIRADLEGYHFDNFYCESHEAERDDFVGTFGGLFFLGFLLSIIFMVSCVIIIYYKQISEGYEDQSRFEIMQKVGMTRDDIKRSINSQMLLVFFIPIVFAIIHLMAVLPVVNKLLYLFGLFNAPLLIGTAAICVAICSVLYVVIYKLTSNAYYRIVA